MLETTYLKGNLYSLRLSKGSSSGKTYYGCGYNLNKYKIFNAEDPLNEHSANINISSEIIKRLTLSLNLDVSIEKPNQFYRVYAQLRKRF
jgi:hypothetical protein